MSRVLWTIKGWKEILQRRRKNHELEFAGSGSWTEEQWQAAYELSRAGYDRMMAVQPDMLVFNEWELIHASFAICEFFGVDTDDDVTAGEIQDILKARGRIIGLK